MRVAVVEDDMSMREALGRLIDASGFEARTFASAEEYLAGRGSEADDCLVLDVYLTGMSGFALRDHLAERGEVPPVVFVTAQQHRDYPTRAREAGCELLAKPVPRELLIGAVRRAIRDRSGRGVE